MLRKPSIQINEVEVSIPLVAINVAVILFLGFSDTGWGVAGVFAGGIVLMWWVAGWPQGFRENAALLAVFSWVGTFYLLEGNHARLAFYEIAAQVLPVVFLTIYVAPRLSFVNIGEPERRLRVIVVYAIVLGEFTALDRVAQGAASTHSDTALSLVAGALVVAGIMLITELIGREPDQDQEVPREDDRTKGPSG